MSSDTAQLIKEKIDIVEFIRRYLELKPAGKNFKANCPFHKEKTPSFIVSPDRQTWHCFGTCAEGGDVIKFLMKYENIEFYDALKILAEKAGVELRISGNRDFNATNGLYKIMEAAKDFFKANLLTEKKIQEYLNERGLKNETIQEFEIGVATDGSDTLIRHLIKGGFNNPDIFNAGLSVKTESGTYKDRFQARVMFPIHNQVGKVVAFTGRVFPWNDNPNVGKYVNSPETPIFQKSKVLYGFYKTKGDIREARAAVLVEGQMDLLMMWQDGVKNAVATSGTALTNDHLIILQRLADELILSFDADEAGQAAAERAIDLANAHDFSVKLLVIDDAKLKDPADMVKAKPGHIAELVKQAKPAMEYYFHKYMKDIPDDLKQKNQRVNIMLKKILILPSQVYQSHWLNELSYRAKVSEEKINTAFDKIKSLSALPAPAASIGKIPSEEIVEEASRRDIILERLLGIMLHLKTDISALSEYSKYIPDKYAEIYKEFFRKDEERSMETKNLMNGIGMKFSFENQNIEIKSLEKEIHELLPRLKKEYLKENRRRLGEKIKQFEREGDEGQLQKALKEHDEISKELQNS